jgi:hypothetical protein
MAHIAGVEKTAEFYAVELALRKRSIERMVRAAARVEHRRLCLEKALKPRKSNRHEIETAIENLQQMLGDLNLEMKQVQESSDEPRPVAYAI